MEVVKVEDEMIKNLQEKETLHVPKNKSTLVIPPDGNCMYNTILAGYLALKGEYPVVEIQGIQYSINSHQDLRAAVRRDYERILESPSQCLDLREAIYATIKDLIESNNFIGFLNAESFLERLKSMKSSRVIIE